MFDPTVLYGILRGKHVVNQTVYRDSRWMQVKRLETAASVCSPRPENGLAILGGFHAVVVGYLL